MRTLALSGSSFTQSQLERRTLLLSNSMGIVLFILSAFLFGLYYYWFNWSSITVGILLIGLLCLSTVWLNHYGFFTISRLWVALFVPLSVTALSVYSKSLYYTRQEELDYFTYRFIILSSCVFPAIFFSIREKFLLFTSSFIGFLLLLGYDPIHAYFGVPFPKQTMNGQTYSFANVVIMITYFITVSAVMFLKFISEQNETRAEKLIRELNQINKELIEKSQEVEAQNQEMQTQSDKLNVNQRRLQDAYKIIEEQKNLLYKQNKNLSTELIEKNKDLTDTNSELIKHNNELRQFSYTISHNLRGPVASLLGLINLVDKKSLPAETGKLFDHISSSTLQLDRIIRDLGKIIDIRHDIFQIRQKISLQKEIDEISQILKREMEMHHVTLKTDFSACSNIYSVKPMVHSILYNLISNAIKYRSSERLPIIEIASTEDIHHYILKVKDNGIGIDLSQYRDSIFKLYKRFHHHTEGKGLGLYLVKLQAETLGGRVLVESEINRETVFTIYLRKPSNVERQILYQEPYAQIFFDAKLNATGVIWKGPVTSEQYRNVFKKCLEFVKAYNTPSYIADLSNQGEIAREDQLWMFKEIMPEATLNGLKRIAAILPDKNNPKVQEYLKGINESLTTLGARQEFFLTMEDAANWIQEENEKIFVNTTTT